MREINYDQLTEQLAGPHHPILLDCRALEYWLWETIPGSTQLRWKDIEQKSRRLLPDHNAPIVTFCQHPHSNSSRRGYATLNELGYTNVWHYSGGVEEWYAKTGVLHHSALRVSTRSLKLPGQRFYGEEVGSYLIDTEDCLVIVDGPQFLSDGNEDFILSFGKPIKIFLTHGPTGGVSSLLEGSQGAEVFLHHLDRDNEWITSPPTTLFDQEFILAPGLRVIHTPGHTPGSCCLYDEYERVLYSGDHLQGSSPSSIWDFTNDKERRGDSAVQLASLRKLMLFTIEKVLPFHYSELTYNPPLLIEEFLRKHEDAR